MPMGRTDTSMKTPLTNPLWRLMQKLRIALPYHCQ
jgi:hypothetical protein